MTMLEIKMDELCKLVGKELTVDEIEELLFNYGMELDEYDSENGTLIVEITPDRPDLLSAAGLARAVKKYLGIERGLSQYTVGRSGVDIIVDRSVEKIRPFIAGAVIKELDINESLLKDIILTQEKLHETLCRKRKVAAIGIYPFQKIVPPIKYCAKNPDEILFTPLGERRIMTGKEILEKHETGQKYKHLIETCDKYPVLIDSVGQILSMPPIINSEEVGRVDEETKEVFIEVTGINLKRVFQVINILTSMFVDMGGKLYSVKVVYKNGKNYKTPDTKPKLKRIKLENVRNLIGLKFKTDEVIDLLERMGYGIKSANNNHIDILIPYYRVDILHEVDVIDDIARAHGLNNMIPELPPVATVGKLLRKTKIINFLRDALIGLGFIECFTLTLTSKKYQYEYMNIIPDYVIEIPNAKSSEMNIVRTWILPELIRCIKANEHYGLPIKLFEINDVVVKDDSTDTGYRNETRLAVLIYNEKCTFTDIKQILDYVMNLLNKKYDLEYIDHGAFIEGRVGKITLLSEKVNVGLVGEVNPIVIKNFGLKYPISAMEIDLEVILNE